MALLDQLEWGPPVPVTAPVFATQDGLCPACGSVIRRDQEIVLARYGPPVENRQTWVHHVCPSWWSLLADTIEEYDDKIITKINQVGRGVARGCGHDVTGSPVYLVRRPVSLTQPRSTDWYCEGCAQPGGGERS